MGIELAVENPLAREIVAACGKLRLETLFEPSKFHPKDWANPGRVKIKLKGGQNPTIKNSMSFSCLPTSLTCGCLAKSPAQLTNDLLSTEVAMSLIIN